MTFFLPIYLANKASPCLLYTSTVEQLDRVIIAGQFGLHLTAESIIGSGLLPKACLDKISYAVSYTHLDVYKRQ